MSQVAPEQRFPDSGIAVFEGYSLIQRTTSQRESRVGRTKHVPRKLFDIYRAKAMASADFKKLDEAGWYASIPNFPGVWAHETNLRDSLNILHEVLTDWLLLKIEDEDRDIPVLDNISLNDL